MAGPSVTYNFTNGTTADADQVDTNFNDLINGATDGTKDYTINALTVGGSATFNGAVTLGNASGDAITITGSISAHIPWSANATYDLGAATLAPRSIYLGNGTKSTRILAGTVGTSWSFTLPNDVPTITGQTMVFNTSGTAEFRYPDKFTATKTANYTATGDETVIQCDPTTGGASFTVTLPAASTMTGKMLTITKIDAGLTYTVTIDANSSELIVPSVQSGQTTYVLYTPYESVTLKCNGTSWFVIHHHCNTDWSASAGITIDGSTSGTDLLTGTLTLESMIWRRIGRDAEVKYRFRQTAASTAGSGLYLFYLPTGIVVDTNYVTADAASTSASPTETARAISGLDGNGFFLLLKIKFIRSAAFKAKDKASRP